MLTGTLDIPISGEQTFYTRHGELFAKICGLLSRRCIFLLHYELPRGSLGDGKTETRMNDFVIYARGLRKSYGSLEAVKGIDFEVSAGEVFGLLGPNGAGKTTTVGNPRRPASAQRRRSAGAWL